MGGRSASRGQHQLHGLAAVTAPLLHAKHSCCASKNFVPGQEPGVGLPLPSAAYPILQSYLDLVIEGGLEFGADYAREILASTVDWSAYWLNDRPLARRPWVYTKE
jgi:hypothetical protein